MPTYEYRCPDGHVVERFMKMSEAAAELTCPVCGKVAVRQLSGGAGLVFKGSGFYLTDYGRNAHRGSAPASGESSKGEGSTGGELKSADSAKPAAEKSDAKKSEPKAETKSTETKPASTASSRGSSGSKPDA